MFELTETFKVQPSKVVVHDIDGVRVRRCRFRLERDFDEATAAGMGQTAMEALDLVADSRVAQVVIKIDAVHAEMKLKGDKGEVVIGKATGVKAIANAPKVPKNEDEDEGPPTIKLEFETGLTEEVYLFIGKNAGDFVQVTARKNQLDLPLEGAAPKPNGGNGSGGGGGAELAESLRSVSGEAPKATLKPPKGKGKKARADWGARMKELDNQPDPQAAATPEEAEDVRAQRLREEKAAEQGVWDDEPDQQAAGAVPTEPLSF